MGNRKELDQLIAQYETAKAENQQLYLDGDQIADIAEEYILCQRFDEAMEIINYGLYLHPGNTDILIEQAYLYLEMYEPDKAQEVADSIADEYDADVKILKATILIDKGKIEEANEILNTTEAEDDLDLIIDIVHIFLNKGHFEYAKEWLDKVDPLYADDESYLFARAGYLSKTDQSKEAIVCYNRLIDMDPYNPSYWLEMAICYSNEANIEKAIEACDFAIVADENCGDAYLLRAHCYFYLSNSDKATEDYKKAIELGAISAEEGRVFIEILHIYDKVEVLTQNGMYKEAHELCEEARTLLSSSYEGTIFLSLVEAKLYLLENLYKEATLTFKALLERSADIDLLYTIAAVYSEFDYLKDAKYHYERIYKMDPNYRDVKERLAIVHLILGNVRKFIKYNNECEHPIDEPTVYKIISNLQEKRDQQSFCDILELYFRQEGK